MFGKHVFETDGQLLNLTTKEQLPLSTPKSELSDHLFLAGQEEAAIKSVLFSEPLNLSLVIVPTWECNLRCSHCFVLEKLKKFDDRHLDQNKLVLFLERFIAKFPKMVRVSVGFIGGEISLRAAECVEIAKKVENFSERYNIDKFIHLTTNGTIFNDNVKNLYEHSDCFTISLDGDESTHNEQRKSFDGSNPYAATIRHIKWAIKSGFREKVLVQASLDGKYHYDEDLATRYLAELIRIGVRPERIKIGALAPNARTTEVPKSYKEFMSSHLFPKPCCKYRCGTNFQLDPDNHLYADYFLDKSQSYIGNLSDDIDKLLQKHKQVINTSMPVLNDEKCLSCPVVGVCWGRCCNNGVLSVKPSSVCDQQALVEKVEEYCKQGAIVEKIVRAKQTTQGKK